MRGAWGPGNDAITSPDDTRPDAADNGKDLAKKCLDMDGPPAIIPAPVHITTKRVPVGRRRLAPTKRAARLCVAWGTGVRTGARGGYRAWGGGGIRKG